MYNYRKEVQIGVKDMVDISKYYKAGEIESEVNALYAFIVPILRGITYSLKREMLDDFGIT